jgi:putative spermidine/putrescine transport system permease protein
MGVVKAQSRVRSSSQNSGVLPLLPFFIFTGFFLIWPVLAVTLKSFRGNNNEWTLDNFRPIIHGGPYFHSFIVSLKLALITAAIGSVVGAFFAFVIVTYVSGRFKNVLDSISAVFANSGGVPLAFMFIAAFGTNGLATKFIKFLGYDIYAGKFTIFSFTGVVLVYTFFQAPLMMLVFQPAISGMRNEWREASANLGASALTYWRRVGIPILLPPFIGAFFLLFAGGFSAYATARALTSGTVSIVPIVIGALVDGNTQASQTNLGASLAVGMIAVALVVMIGYVWAQKRTAKWRLS